MKKFLRFSLEEKMVLGYLPVILVIMAIAAVSLHGLHKMKRINDAILTGDTELIQLAGQMADTLLAQEGYARRFLILRSDEMRQMFDRKNDDFKNLTARLAALPEDKGLPLARLIAAHDGFVAFYHEEFKKEEPAEEAEAPERDPLHKNRLDELLGILAAIEKIGTDSRQEKMERFADIGASIFRTTLLLSLLGITIGLGTAMVITRGIARSVRRLKAHTEFVSQGRFDQRAEIDSEDELGDLARSFNAMTRRLGMLESMYIDSSPLTRLPGGLAIENILKQRLEEHRLLAFCMMDLDNFKSFNDRYGYARGNEVIKATAEIIVSAVSAHGQRDDFVGHIGGDDFAIIVSPDRFVAVCETVIREFDRRVLSFYSNEDRERGYIVGRTRQGVEIRFPIMTISIAAVTNEHARQMNHIEISEIAAELKEHAKSLPGSVYVVNRRKEQPTDSEQCDRFVPRVIK